jgi:GR25 family glycosyltransferase involved in LPS biosynthesis
MRRTRFPAINILRRRIRNSNRNVNRTQNIYKILRQVNAVRDDIPAQYNVNKEIYGLARQFGKRVLPPIELPPLSNGSLQWPLHIPVYAISIREDRKQAFTRRFESPSQIWQGTNGKSFNPMQFTRVGRVISNTLKPGEIGCYDSHYRLWQHIAHSDAPMTLICEDDVNLTASPVQSQYLNNILDELNGVSFDVLFLSWFRPNNGDNVGKVTAHMKLQWTFCQLWAYVLTKEGACKLLADSIIKNMHEPVDVALWSAHSRGAVKNLVAYPPLCLTVGSHSDTANLR